MQAKLIALLLSICIMLQLTGSSVLLLSYELNKEQITKTLCVNRNKPRMHCNGKCHLKKQLQEQEKKENVPFNNLKSKSEEWVPAECSFSFIPAEVKGAQMPVYIFRNYSAPLFSVFHPPCA